MIIGQSDEEMVEGRVLLFVKAKSKPEQSQSEKCRGLRPSSASAVSCAVLPPSGETEEVTAEE